MNDEEKVMFEVVMRNQPVSKERLIFLFDRVMKKFGSAALALKNLDDPVFTDLDG